MAMKAKPTITIDRCVYLTDCTAGLLSVNGKEICTSFERPWQGNARRKSCIPVGKYEAKLRPSNQMTRTTGGRWTDAYELADVPGRSEILIHPGNYPHETLGCILLGGTFQHWGGKGWAVDNSRGYYAQVLAELTNQNGGEIPTEIIVNITVRDVQQLASAVRTLIGRE